MHNYKADQGGVCEQDLKQRCLTHCTGPYRTWKGLCCCLDNPRQSNFGMVDLRDGNHCECCGASRKSFALEQVGKPSGKEKTKKKFLKGLENANVTGYELERWIF